MRRSWVRSKTATGTRCGQTELPPNARRHGRQLWRYLESPEVGAVGDEWVQLFVEYPRRPRTRGRAELRPSCKSALPLFARSGSAAGGPPDLRKRRIWDKVIG